MFEAVRTILHHGINEGWLQGFAVALGRGADVFFRDVGGSLDSEAQKPVTEKTQFDLDGLTQLMVTTPLALLAMESGRLSLRDPIAHYVPAPQDKQNITIQQLLLHTAGIKPAFLLEQVAQNAEDSLRALLEQPLATLPGKRTRYSPMGFVLLGKILETLYGMPLDAAAKKYVFTPLGMKHTGYFPSGEDVACIRLDCATGEGGDPLPYDENARFLHGVSGGAGLFSALEDCCRFLGLFAKQKDHPALLTDETLRLWTATRYAQGKKTPRTLGFELATDGDTFMGELCPEGCNGLCNAVGTSFFLEPESGVYIALLMNRAHPSQHQKELLRLRRLVHNSLYADYRRGQREAQA